LSFILTYFLSSLRKTIRWPKNNAHKIFQKVTSSKIKLIKLIGEEFQPVSKRIKLQELHYLESLPATEKNSVQPSHVIYVPMQKNVEKCVISVQSVKRNQPFVWKIVLRSSTNNKILFYFLNLN
jgi:hypothetical protein